MRKLLLILPLTACADIPELRDTVSAETAAAPYLDFLTVDQMAAVQGTPPALEDDEFDARLAGLRARAEALRGPVFSGDDRARLRKPAS